jgi:ribosomal protein S18 acetylase RimI-like enzyme
MTPFTIRPAKVEDALGIAQVHVDSWRTTYTGIMPDELLASQSVERREAIWRSMLSNSASQTFMFVAEADDKVVGFAAAGRERGEHPVYKGELYAIYLLVDYQGQGIGRALVTEVVGKLIERGFTTMLIWVAVGNPAVRFYEALGGHPVGSKSESFGDVMIEEIAYGYDDIRKMIKPAT